MIAVCKKLVVLLCGLSVSVLSACSFAPEYERPAIDMPEAWKKVEVSSPTLEQDWWKRFEDPILTALIEEALKNNIDLEESLAALDSAAAQLGTSRSALFPNLTGTGSAGASGSSITGPNGDAQREQYDNGILERNTTSYSFGLSTSWELDLWGKYRNAYTGLSDVLLSTKVGYEALRLSIAGQTAKTYFSLLALDMQLATAKRTLESREEGLEIYSVRFNQGDITELDLLRAKSEVETARASMLTSMVEINNVESALAVLLGRSPREIMSGTVERGMKIEEMPSPPAIPEGLPSELLMRRPDVRAAEYMVMAYNANIGVAKADFFPSISLTGSLGTLSGAAVALFSGPAGTWSYGISGTLPIFDFGRRWYAVEDAEAQKRRSVALYRKTVQEAFQDIRTSLTAQRMSKEIVDTIQAQVDNMRRATELARLQYDNGYADYLTVLDAERGLFEVELQLAAVMSNRLSAVVDVCMALGGGWMETSVSLQEEGAEREAMGTTETLEPVTPTAATTENEATGEALDEDVNLY